MNVLIIGDIGSGKNDWIHIGDEAMFLGLFFMMKKKYPNAKLSALSRTISHKELELIEIVNDSFFSNTRFIFVYTCRYFIKLLLKRFLRINTFSLKENELIQHILKQNHVVISGGGNLNSHFPAFLAHRSIISFICKLWGVPIQMSSQSLGPFSKYSHRIVLGFILMIQTSIGIRDKSYSIQYIPKIFHHKTKQQLDDAYLLKPFSQEIQLSNQSSFKIGICLRDWDSAEMYQLVNRLSDQIQSIDKQIEVYFIPHITDKQDQGDLDKMQMFLEKFRSPISITHSEIRKNRELRPELFIFSLTKKMDLILSTRYHGIVFALANNIPVIGLHENDYYKRKNLGAYEHISVTNSHLTSFDLRSDKTPNDLQKAFKELILLNDKHKRQLSYENKKLNDTFIQL